MITLIIAKRIKIIITITTIIVIVIIVIVIVVIIIIIIVVVIIIIIIIIIIIVVVVVVFVIIIIIITIIVVVVITDKLMTVRSLKAVLRTLCRIISTFLFRTDITSSITMNFDLFRMALAKHSSWAQHFGHYLFIYSWIINYDYRFIDAVNFILQQHKIYFQIITL